MPDLRSVSAGEVVVVRGWVEPPTFRFSGLSTTVQERPYGSFYVFSVGLHPAINSGALSWMRPKLTAVPNVPGLVAAVRWQGLGHSGRLRMSVEAIVSAEPSADLR